jgi:hypothetical protein
MSRSDFDWTSGDQPVEAVVTFNVIMTKVLRTSHFRDSTGLILREVPDNVCERMGLLVMESTGDTGDSSLEEIQQWANECVASLPICDVRII